MKKPYMQSRSRTFITLLGFTVFIYGSTISPARAAEMNVYAAAEDFTWKEFADDGSRLLKESGVLAGVGLVYWKELPDHVTIKPLAELFGGTVDYEGQACDRFTNICIPARTDVDYFGLKLQGEIGKRSRTEAGYFVEPFGGLGFWGWYRDINSGTAADGRATAGYTEQWITFNARLGLRSGRELSAEKQVFAEAGVKYPLYNRNTAYLSDAGLGDDITLHPGKQSSLFAEAGMKIKRLSISLFYDSFKFSKSNVLEKIEGSFISRQWQPKSTMDLYGLKVGVVF